MGSPIRILHVVVNMNRGGAETLIMNLYRNIDRSKIQFDFLTCKKGVFDPEITRMGGRIYRIPYVTKIGHFKYIKVLNHFFQTHQEYKIVHSHMDKMSGFVLRSAAKAEIPVRIAHSHSTNSQGSIVSKVYKWYAGRHLLSNSTHLMACSKKSAEWLFLHKADESIILKNAIDCDQVQFSVNQREIIRTQLNIDRDTFVMGHVGRFDNPKNHNFLIEIFKEIVDEIPNTILLLVGDGDLRPGIENKVNALGLRNHVKFLGVRNDVHRLLQAMDVFVFPSLYEGLPVSLIEAQGAGLPCVASDQISEESDMGINAIKYLSLNNKSEWVDTIIGLTQKERIIETKLAITQRGYDIGNIAGSTKDIYLSLVRT